MITFKEARRWLCYVGVLLFVIPAVLPTTATADIYIAPGNSEGDTLTYSDGDIVATGGWAAGGTTFTYLVTRPEDPTGPYTYWYEFTGASGPGTGLSHLIIEVSDDMTADGGLQRFSIENEMDFISTGQWPDGDARSYEPGQDGQSNPNLPEAIFGLKFEADGTNTWTVEFQSYRNPMWGDFYAKGGLADAWNSGLEAYGEAKILVPNASYVPVPGAALLGFLGLGAAGLRLRKRV